MGLNVTLSSVVIGYLIPLHQTLGALLLFRRRQENPGAFNANEYGNFEEVLLDRLLSPVGLFRRDPVA